MSYAIADKLSLTVVIEDLEVPFSDTMTFNYLHLSCSTRKALPYFVLSVTDGLKWFFATSALKDGHRVRIILQPGDASVSSEYKYTFRLGSFKESPHSVGSVFVLEGVMDVPQYFNNSSRNPIVGTSADVLKKIAKEVGLAFEGIGTNDNQAWLPMNRRLFTFAQYIANAGYASENSAMLLGVDLSKTMVYRDITAMDAPKHKLGLMNFDAKSVIPVVSIQPHSQSGSLNQIAGYTMTTIEQDLDSDAVHTKNTAIGTVVNEAGDLLVNADLKASGKEGRVAYGPVNVGNAHPNFTRARHQNRRVASLFSFECQVVIPTITPVKILDTVNLDAGVAESMDSSSAATYSGLYRVTDKVIYVVPGQLVEKLTLVRRTISSPDVKKSPSTKTSVPKSAGSLVTTAQEKLSKSLPLSFKVPTSLAVPSFNPAGLLASVSGFGTQALAGIQGAASNALGSLSKVGASLAAAPPITSMLGSTTGGVSGLQDACIAQIDAIKALDPLDLAGDIPIAVADFKGQIDTLITTDLPDLTTAALKATSISNAANKLGAAAGSITGVFDRAKKAAEAGMAALDSISIPGSLTSAISAASSPLAGAVSSSVSSLASSVTAAASTANGILADSTTFDTQIDDAQAGAESAIDAAAII